MSSTKQFICKYCGVIKKKDDYVDNGWYEIMEKRQACANCMDNEDEGLQFIDGEWYKTR